MRISVNTRLLLIWVMIISPAMLHAQQLKYVNGNDGWNADSLGNHRAVVRFTGQGQVAHVILNWRRRDAQPADKRIIIQDGKTGALVNNIRIAGIDKEKGDIYFEPVSGKGLYYIYYMPYRNE